MKQDTFDFYVNLLASIKRSHLPKNYNKAIMKIGKKGDYSTGVVNGLDHVSITSFDKYACTESIHIYLAIDDKFIPIFSWSVDLNGGRAIESSAKEVSDYSDMVNSCLVKRKVKPVQVARVVSVTPKVVKEVAIKVDSVPQQTNVIVGNEPKPICYSFTKAGLKLIY